MHLVYRTCRQCIIWLGRDVEYVKEVEFLCTYVYPLLRQFQDIPQALFWEGDWKNSILSSLNMTGEEFERMWGSLRQFHQKRRWFRRAWIIQEYVLSPERRMLCGGKEIPVNELFTIMEFAQKGKFGGICEPYWKFLESLKGYLRQELENPYLSEQLRIEFVWKVLLTTSGMFISSEPHDILYCLIGIFQVSWPSSCCITDYLIVDYKRPAAEVFTHIVDVFLSFRHQKCCNSCNAQKTVSFPTCRPGAWTSLHILEFGPPFGMIETQSMQLALTLADIACQSTARFYPAKASMSEPCTIVWTLPSAGLITASSF